VELRRNVSFRKLFKLKVPMNFVKSFTFAVGAFLLCGTGAQAVPVSGQGTWETTLQARDLNADGITDAFYDTELNVTWLRDANANGYMTWNAANTWAGNLVVGGYGGWRLPALVDTGVPGCDFSYAGGTDCGYNVQTKASSIVYSELAHLYYTTLGAKGFCLPDIVNCTRDPGWSLTNNSGNFQNLRSYYYWSAAQDAPGYNRAWGFDMGYGYQYNLNYNSFEAYTVAVHPGDLTAAVPEPETYALMLAGLTALVVVQRRRAVGASAF
jgi:hypothetical protein